MGMAFVVVSTFERHGDDPSSIAPMLPISTASNALKVHLFIFAIMLVIVLIMPIDGCSTNLPRIMLRESVVRLVAVGAMWSICSGVDSPARMSAGKTLCRVVIATVQRYQWAHCERARGSRVSRITSSLTMTSSSLASSRT